MKKTGKVLGLGISLLTISTLMAFVALFQNYTRHQKKIKQKLLLALPKRKGS